MSKLNSPFQTKPPRLKDLVNEYVMGDVWIRDTPFGPVTDSLKIAEKFQMEHKTFYEQSTNVRQSSPFSSNLS